MGGSLRLGANEIIIKENTIAQNFTSFKNCQDGTQPSFAKGLCQKESLNQRCKAENL